MDYKFIVWFKLQIYYWALRFAFIIIITIIIIIIIINIIIIIIILTHWWPVPSS